MTSRAQEIFFEVFEPLPRQGPGTYACARRAFELCRELPPRARVLDLGCGAGAQTLQLASWTDGTILALDSHAPLVERLRAKLEERALFGRIEARVADMGEVERPPEGFDLVWSEGALYNIGLETALPLCTRLLCPGGYLVFTEAVWRTADAPKDVRQAFADYPAMGRIEDVASLIDASSLSLVEHFDLPEEAWWEDFYTPMEERIEALRRKYTGDAEAMAALDEVAKEPQMHRRSGHHYGYTFFVARRL